MVPHLKCNTPMVLKFVLVSHIMLLYSYHQWRI